VGQSSVIASEAWQPRSEVDSKAISSRPNRCAIGISYIAGFMGCLGFRGMGLAAVARESLN